jgi:transcription initiation factor TFIIIB Brf1 subunit/transcription initiation factor TFIIB
MLTARCRDCGKKHLVYDNQLGYAAPPRCKTCGGILDLTTASQEVHAQAREDKMRRKRNLVPKRFRRNKRS